MNIYFIGMCVAMLVFIGISILIKNKIKSAEDFYVAGRKATLFLIAGSMIASYTSTGMFMGDAAEAYEGALAPMILFAGIQSSGYIIGAVFFGRYLRRSKAMTIPEFFGIRFCSNKMRVLSAVTAIIMMSVYLLSVIQGVGTLMSIVTNVDYNKCIVLVLTVFTIITVISGSKGVLVTDTLMATIFTTATLISVFFIANKVGGWNNSINFLSKNSNYLFSWSGKPGVLYNNGIDNTIWGFTYGIVWCSVCAIGPWQSSRYLMAKDEQTIIKSALIAALGVFLLEFFVCTSAVVVNKINPNITPSSHVWIWISMNVLPKILGIILMTGVLSAGISSATTFLSLIGASIANDIINSKGDSSIRIGQFVMVIVSLVVLSLAILNPPAIFIIMFLGGATAASSWMPVAFASIISRKLTKLGAFLGMLFGMIGCLGANLLKSFCGVNLPSYLDPAIIGICCNIIAMIVGTSISKITKEEIVARKKLFVIPNNEKNKNEVRETLLWLRGGVWVGLIMVFVMLSFWITPYLHR